MNSAGGQASKAFNLQLLFEQTMENVKRRRAVR